MPDCKADEAECDELLGCLGHDAAAQTSKATLAAWVDDARGEEDDLLWYLLGEGVVVPVLEVELVVGIPCLRCGQRKYYAGVGGEGEAHESWDNSLRTMPGTTMPGTSTAVDGKLRFSDDDGAGVSWVQVGRKGGA